MKSSSTSLLCVPSASNPYLTPRNTSLATIRNPPRRTGQLFSRRRNKRSNFSFCRATRTSEYYSEFNLYELLGVEPSSNTAQIKEAYRTLQKRCHPDIAGPPGHDMAIVLNEAYALLSDPHTRMAYDKELAKVSDFQGYTGRPIYSVWQGSDKEERAVFVDEVQCVGCLKCALFAEKTFAIESVYGRARVVAQWADPEYKIQEAIGTCPVDCISIIDRSNLAALEFMMSKQPRGNVRIGVGNTVGARAIDIFDELKKFQARYAQHKAGSTNSSQESEIQRASRVSAIQTIQMISNWLYWQSPNAYSTPPAVQNSQQSTRGNPPNIKRLRAAAAARKQIPSASRPQYMTDNTNEYWVPSPVVQTDTPTQNAGSKPAIDPSTTRKVYQRRDTEFSSQMVDSGNLLRRVAPMVSAVVAAVVVQLHPVDHVARLEDHIGGFLPQSIVNSSGMQALLAGVTWFLITQYIVELVAAFWRR